MPEMDHQKNTTNKVIGKGKNSKNRAEEETAPGYGDKKLEGPNRPSE